MNYLILKCIQCNEPSKWGSLNKLKSFNFEQGGLGSPKTVLHDTTHVHIVAHSWCEEEKEEEQEGGVWTVSMYVFTEISDVTAGKGEDMNTSDIVIQPHHTIIYNINKYMQRDLRLDLA